MKYKIKVVRQSKSAAWEYWAEATDGNEMYVLGIGGNTKNAAMKELKQQLDIMHKQEIVHEETYEV